MEKKVVDILNAKRGFGLSITEIVKASSLSRSKVRIILARLEGAGKVFVRKVGMAKIYFLSEDKKKRLLYGN